MPVLFHGKEYKTVAERLEEAKDDILSINTEVLYIEPKVMVKATVTTKKGVFTGISAANPDKMIEEKTPVEVAETSAVGRALAFAGYAGTEIASADEMVKAGVVPQKDELTSECPIHEVKMYQAISKKTGNPYWYHKLDDGSYCFGKTAK